MKNETLGLVQAIVWPATILLCSALIWWEIRKMRRNDKE